MNTPARSRDLFRWTREWPADGSVRVHAGLTGRMLPGFPAAPDSPYGSGNLGRGVNDNPAAVAARRAAVATAAGVSRLIMPTQVHGTEVVVVGADTPDGVTADALVTSLPDVALGVTVADCVPVMLVDAVAGVIGVAHAGRKGMAEGVVPATLDAMAALGAGAVTAVVGPSICARCYEVPADLRDQVGIRWPVSASVTRAGTPSIDVVAGVLEQLAARAVEIELLPGCTAESTEFFSHRGSGGRAGRFGGFVWKCSYSTGT